MGSRLPVPKPGQDRSPVLIPFRWNTHEFCCSVDRMPGYHPWFLRCKAKGDFYLLQDNDAAAFTAYESALASNESQDPMIRNILQLKISQVRPAEVAEMEEDDSEGVAE